MKKQSPRFNYKEYKPPVSLRKFIDKIWIFESYDESEKFKNFRLIPNYTSSLIVILPAEPEKLQLFLTGPNTQSMPIANFSDQIVFGFSFFSYNMPSLFGTTPADTLNSKITPQILGSGSTSAELTAKLRRSGSLKEMSKIIAEFLSDSLGNITMYSDDISMIIERIISSDGSVKLEEIYSALTISQRQFQRKFSKRTGLTPKEFSKLVRFHHVTRKLVKNNFRHFDTLVESGYYDQSHYYREFKEFIGMLPSRFESRQKHITHRKLLK